MLYRDVKLKMFQYKTLHGIRATNKNILKLYGIKYADICDYYGLTTGGTHTAPLLRMQSFSH